MFGHRSAVLLVNSFLECSRIRLLLEAGVSIWDKQCHSEDDRFCLVRTVDFLRRLVVGEMSFDIVCTRVITVMTGLSARGKMLYCCHQYVAVETPLYTQNYRTPCDDVAFLEFFFRVSSHSRRSLSDADIHAL